MKNISLKTGFTLVEIMIVCICTALLMGPMFLILRSSSQTSLKGMLRIDTTLEARRIIKQIHSDIKLSCFPKPHRGGVWSINDNITNGGVPPLDTYTLFVFPIHADESKVFEKEASSNIIYTNVSQVTYQILNKDKFRKRLVRKEKFKNEKEKVTILSDRINYLDIRKAHFNIQGKLPQWYFVVTLQLIDALKDRDLEGKDLDGSKLDDLKSKVILADFYDVVYPEYLNSMSNEEGSNPNWYSYIKLPPGT